MIWDGVGTQECSCCGVEKTAEYFKWMRKAGRNNGEKIPYRICLECSAGGFDRMLSKLANDWRGPVDQIGGPRL